MRNVLQAAILTGALAVSGSVAAAETREHDAHVHGTASVDIALVGEALAIDLYSPAMNIVGFEHAPGNADQRATLADALTTLRAAERIFTLPDAADCRSIQTDASRVVDQGHEEHEEHEGDARHSEIRAHYRFECDTPGKLDRLRVRLFERFPATEAIRVQLLTETAQRAVVLTADRPDVPF